MAGRRERRQRARAVRRGGNLQPAPEIAGLIAAARQLLQADELGRAEQLATQALAIVPEDPEACHLLGLVYYQAGRPDKARPLLEKSVSAAPGLTIHRVNLAAALQALGNQAAAIRHYRKAISHDPSYALAHNNLGHALKETGELAGALAAFRRALELQPGHIGARRGLIRVLQYLRTDRYDPAVAGMLLDCLSSPLADPLELSAPIARQLTLKYGLAGDIGGEVHGRQEIANAPPPPEALENIRLQELASDPLVLAYFGSCMNVAIPLEELLRRSRRRLLLQRDVRERDVLRPLLAAFARQGYLNEYVVYADKSEWEAVDKLRSRIEAALAASRSGIVLDADLLIYAAYTSPEHIHDIDALLSVEEIGSDVRDLLRLTVADRREEARIRQDIESFAPIEDRVSQGVRDQYEENPYPRWMRSPERPPAPPAVYLKRIYPHFESAGFLLNSELSVLVAGAGTGSHPINVARDMPKARILAFDLSLSSLAYGIRMARKLEIDNISFLQGDILKAEALGEHGPFDMIQCIGVLHHMKDPLAGWRILARLLRPGGVFKLGLYSERARQGVVRARAAIAKLGLDASPLEIAAFRRMLSTARSKRISGTLWQCAISIRPAWSAICFFMFRSIAIRRCA